jgi:drug/metabolite transporter (DMT)-like permease
VTVASASARLARECGARCGHFISAYATACRYQVTGSGPGAGHDSGSPVPGANASPLGISAATLAIATVLLAPGAATSLPVRATPTAWAALAALGVLCTAAAFALYYQLIAEAGATRAALSVYLAPIFSVLTGVLVLGEAVTASAFAGLALILTGSWLAR